MTPLRTSIIRLAHTNPELRPHLLPLLTARTTMRFRDLPNVEDLYEGFQRLTKVWSSERDAERALARLLDDNGLEEAYRSSGRLPNSQQLYMRTRDGEDVKDPLNVFHRPGPRPGWTSFQVSL